MLVYGVVEPETVPQQTFLPPCYLLRTTCHRAIHIGIYCAPSAFTVWWMNRKSMKLAGKEA
jgi:hypothetical protein